MVHSAEKEVDSESFNPFAKLTADKLLGLQGKCIAVSKQGIILESANSHREIKDLMNRNHNGVHYNFLCLPDGGSLFEVPDPTTEASTL